MEEQPQSNRSEYPREGQLYPKDMTTEGGGLVTIKKGDDDSLTDSSMSVVRFFLYNKAVRTLIVDFFLRAAGDVPGMMRFVRLSEMVCLARPCLTAPSPPSSSETGATFASE